MYYNNNYYFSRPDYGYAYGNPYGLNFSRSYPRVVAYNFALDDFLKIGGAVAGSAAGHLLRRGANALEKKFGFELPGLGVGGPESLGALAGYGAMSDFLNRKNLQRQKTFVGRHPDLVRYTGSGLGQMAGDLAGRAVAASDMAPEGGSFVHRMNSDNAAGLGTLLSIPGGMLGGQAADALVK